MPGGSPNPLFRIQIDRPHRNILSRSSACTASQPILQCSNVGTRRPESRKQGAADRLLPTAEMVLKKLESRK
ncbi:hypothetical protein [Bradyrhizobium monzae]|uniref:hypothetical protein n=1 Tax=Bradyrhizobium sp. Oc8 TaxID=2876780 RepID=UPI001F40B7F1|nr:hypothetical protein [Bradyrhizobium sp. Oc8]